MDHFWAATPDVEARDGIPTPRPGRGMNKDRLQREFAEGQIKVLVCTDAAAEGLNLQNCGSMINYDMPWNPMKVEQRIGRIDRIGQRRPKVRARHFMYSGTVESDVYSALGDRIDWFETVVGDLQPILQVRAEHHQSRRYGRGNRARGGHQAGHRIPATAGRSQRRADGRMESCIGPSKTGCAPDAGFPGRAGT